MTTPTTPIERHPDLMELRARYDQAAETAPARAAYGLTFLSGLYAAISPWVVGFQGVSTVAVSNLVCGLAVVALAMGFASAYGRTHTLAWVTPLLGAWLIVSPWVIQASAVTTGMIVSNVITGGLVVLLGLGVAFIGMGTARRGRFGEHR